MCRVSIAGLGKCIKTSNGAPLCIWLMTFLTSYRRKKVCKFSSDPPAYFRCLGNRGIRANATDSGHNLLTDWDPIMVSQHMIKLPLLSPLSKT